MFLVHSGQVRWSVIVIFFLIRGLGWEGAVSDALYKVYKRKTVPVQPLKASLNETRAVCAVSQFSAALSTSVAFPDCLPMVVENTRIRRHTNCLAMKRAPNSLRCIILRLKFYLFIYTFSKSKTVTA